MSSERGVPGIGTIPLLSGLVLLSGASALIYQLLWLRLLGLVFGVTVHAASTVLASLAIPTPRSPHAGPTKRSAVPARMMTTARIRGPIDPSLREAGVPPGADGGVGTPTNGHADCDERDWVRALAIRLEDTMPFNIVEAIEAKITQDEVKRIAGSTGDEQDARHPLRRRLHDRGHADA